jgi:hypothetical protein
LTGTRSYAYDFIEKNNLLKHDKTWPKDSLNKSLLFVGNIGFRKRASKSKSLGTEQLHLWRLLESVATGTLAQAYGRVRMLLWMSVGEKEEILPGTVSRRKKMGVLAELLCEIDEVAGPDKQSARTRRSTDLDLERAGKLVSQMKSVGILTPANRKTLFERVIDTGGDVVNRPWIEEYRTMEQKFKDHKLLMFVGDDTVAQDGRRGRQKKVHREKTPEYQRLLILRAKWREYNNKQNQLKENKPDSAPRDLSTVNVYQDDRALFSQKTLAYDNVQYMPILTRDSDFDTPQSLALIDIRPREPPKADFWKLNELLTGLFFRSAQPIGSAMGHLGPSAVQALDEIAATGAIDKSSRVRTMPVDILLKIVEKLN